MSLGFTIPGKSKTHTQHPRQGHMPTHGRVFVTCFVKEKQCWHVFATFGAEGVRASTTKRCFNDFKDIDAKVRHLFFKCNHVGTATDTLCLRTVHSQTLCFCLFFIWDQSNVFNSFTHVPRTPFFANSFRMFPNGSCYALVPCPVHKTMPRTCGSRYCVREKPDSKHTNT